MTYLISIFIAGLIGGILRGLVGFQKYQTKYKGVKFNPYYFFGMTTLSGIIGLLSAWIAKDVGIVFIGIEELPPSIALVIGYAGGDFIENLFRIITGKTSLYSFPIPLVKNDSN